MKRFLALLTGVIFCTGVFAQNVKISGTVVAKDDGLPLPGVAVMIKGMSSGTQTDLDGLYEISVPKGSTVVFSYISFRDYELVASNDGVFNIAMETDVLELDAVVAIGYGVMKKSDLTGSVASVKGE